MVGEPDVTHIGMFELNVLGRGHCANAPLCTGEHPGAGVYAPDAGRRCRLDDALQAAAITFAENQDLPGMVELVQEAEPGAL
jgi:hypothetical protein